MSRSLPWGISIILAILLGLLWYEAKQNLAQKDAELAELQGRYAQLAVDANSKIAQLTQQANEKIRLANQPEIPIRVSFRKAWLASGNVAGFHNLSAQTVAVVANVERPLSGQGRAFTLAIDPGVTKEIGEVEGWAFVPGDSITLTQPEHKSLLVRAP